MEVISVTQHKYLLQTRMWRLHFDKKSNTTDKFPRLAGHLCRSIDTYYDAVRDLRK